MPVLEREVFNVLDLPVQDLMPDMDREREVFGVVDLPVLICPGC